MSLASWLLSFIFKVSKQVVETSHPSNLLSSLSPSPSLLSLLSSLPPSCMISLASPGQTLCFWVLCTGVSGLIALCFIELHRYCIFFLRLKVCGNSAWNKCISTIFPIAWAHFVSLCQIIVSAF